MLVDAIELATNQRRKNVHNLQCIKCKKHFRGRTREITKALLYFHEQNGECIDRTITYKVPYDRELKYDHYYGCLLELSKFVRSKAVRENFVQICPRIICPWTVPDKFPLDSFGQNLHGQLWTKSSLTALDKLTLINSSFTTLFFLNYYN